MEKPISLIIEETKTSIADILNNCHLHPFVMDVVMKELYEEVHAMYLAQSEKEKKAYLESLDAEKAEVIEGEIVESA